LELSTALQLSYAMLRGLLAGSTKGHAVAEGRQEIELFLVSFMVGFK